MILADTNIFLEILLEQEAKEDCKQFLSKNIDQVCMSVFSLHSIGVILFKQNKQSIFTAFVNDLLPNIKLISISEKSYHNIEAAKINYGLDFDDAYQFCIVQENKLEIATRDKDFNKVKNSITVHFV